MKRWWLALIVLAALAVPAAGLAPIQASSRHWAITSWVLDSVKRRSVATYSLTVDTPPLDDAGIRLRGAGHYEQGCRPCHGSPLVPPPPIPHGMTPHPPDLKQQVARWKPRELFYIVKHGIKFTGMPAWPVLVRDDEIWSMVAFLRLLPSMDGPTYERMTRGEATPSPTARPSAAGDDSPLMPPLDAGAQAALARCASCHGADGLGRGGAFPRLAGQRLEYLELALDAYRRGMRHSGVMVPMAADIDEEVQAMLVGYYASLPSAVAQLDSATASPGARIVDRGIPEQDVPACRECHGPGPPKNAAYPNLAGQPADYLALQLQLLAEGRRGGSSFETIMRPIATRLTKEQRHEVAAFYARGESSP